MRKFVRILLTSSIILSQVPTTKSNKRVGPSTRIIGGTAASVGEYEWFTWLGACGGSLIDEEFVLTAAHCAGTIFVNQKVKIGALCIHHTQDNCGQFHEEIGIKRFFLHPQYSQYSNTPAFDFMIIQLDTRSTITPVKLDSLPNFHSPGYDEGKELWALGFGVTDVNDQGSSNILLEASVGYIPNAACKQQYRPTLIKDSMICAASPGRDACQGDSGGPLYDRDNGVIVGLVSWGYGCASELYPGVYARLSEGWPWIQETVCDNYLSDSIPTICSGIKTHSPTITPAPTFAPIACSALPVTLNLMVGRFGYETSWNIQDLGNGNVIESRGNYDAFESSTFQTCLEHNRCYQFAIFDSFGDGLNRQASYSLIADQKPIAQNGRFEWQEMTVFGDCEECRPFTIRLELATDTHGHETAWEISKYDNLHDSIIYHGGFGGEYRGNQFYNLTMNLCNGCYVFSLFDLYGDGIDVTEGNYTLVTDDEIFTGGDFASSESFMFGNCRKEMGCNANEIKVEFKFQVRGNGSISWSIVDQDTNKFVEMSTYTSSEQKNLCIPHKCYSVKVSGLSFIDRRDGGFEYSVVVDGEIFSLGKDVEDTFDFGCGVDSGTLSVVSASSSYRGSLMVSMTACIMVLRLSLS